MTSPGAFHKVNGKHFAQVPLGSPVQIAGQLFKDDMLNTTDGVSLRVHAAVCSVTLIAWPGYVELVGKKASGENGHDLLVHEVRILQDTLDLEIWNGAIEMRHHPELKQFYDPRPDLNGFSPPAFARCSDGSTPSDLLSKT
eukprot:gnl/MRDRNA2_/MRDRNA2_269896_c0_seq1.p1 gnl/MRDRNA2_/MRDRNA2_269896_c0~~gnl/MRDRNA2_/MRDRNA2_269896_c0_seq1.p1  ORF type:complete len:150 (+),score=22.03 gnl/MRDRNA2_/MRDRNA2_269896_c0_seq1:29-451(+)